MELLLTEDLMDEMTRKDVASSRLPLAVGGASFDGGFDGWNDGRGCDFL